eukprot:1344522-Pleurochrysis_carterae.AAC.1
MAQSSTPARDGEANGSPMSTSSPPVPAAAPSASSNRVPKVRLRLAFFCVWRFRSGSSSVGTLGYC